MSNTAREHPEALELLGMLHLQHELTTLLLRLLSLGDIGRDSEHRRSTPIVSDNRTLDGLQEAGVSLGVGD